MNIKTSVKRFVCYSTSIAIIFFIIGLTLVTSIQFWKNDNFVCDANLIVQKKSTKLSVVMSYYMNGERGYTIIKGFLNKDGDTFNISRKNTFNFRTSQNLVYAISTSVDKTPADNAPSELLKDIIPEFYFVNDKKIEFSIYHQGEGGYIFSTGFVPSFYCKRYDYKASIFYEFMNVIGFI